MRIDFAGSITTVTEVTYSYADSRKEGSCILLPCMNGLPPIPARLLRGALRHLNFRPIIRRLKEQDLRLTLEDWRFNLNGGIRQEGNFVYNVLLDRHKFENHAFVGLWGCMDPIAYTGKAQIEIGVATKNYTPIIVAGQRTDAVQRGEVTPDDVSDPDSFASYIASLDVNRQDRKDKATRIAARKKGESPTDDGAEEKPRVITANLPHSRECIPRGVTFDHHMSLKRDTSPLQLGQFLIALEEFAADPIIGAQSGINAGLVNMHYVVSIDHKPFGEITIDGRSASFELTGDLNTYIKLFWDTFAEMDFSIPLKAKPAKG
jgi:hypothetical protein